MFRILGFMCILSFSLLANSQENSSHTVSGTRYDRSANNMYAKVRHGPDGKLFLDPYFIPFIENVHNQRILDAGCGAGPWAIHAALQGAKVSCIDIQQNMLDQAKAAAKQEKVDDKIDFALGDVALLPYSNAYFQRALSINVGCNLPSTTIIKQLNGTTQKVGLGPHFSEMARVLEPQGKLIVTAPASFGVVFSNNGNNDIQSLIQKSLSKIKNIQDTQEIVSTLNMLTDVNRATFVVRNNQLKLVTDERELSPGEDIWRKLPGLVVPNRYHSEKEYLEEARKAGFKLVKIHREKFKDEGERVRYNSIQEPSLELSNAYVNHHPFIVMEFEKIS